LSIFFRRKRRKYGDVKPKPLPTRGFEWLSPRTKEAQRFIRAPEVRRWGGKTFGQWGTGVGVAAAPFTVNPPSFAPQAPAAQALAGAPITQVGGVQAQPQPSLGTALGVPPTRTFTVGGRTVTQAPVPFVKPAPTGAGYEVPAPAPTRPVYGRGF